MTMTTHQRRFVANAGANPQGYAQYSQRVYGQTPADVERLLRMHQHLSAGQGLTKDHVRELQRMHPNVDPKFVAGMAEQLNAQHPGQRAAMFIGAVVGDRNAMQGRFDQAGDEYRQAEKLAEDYGVQHYAEAINAKRGGSDDARPAWKPEPGSTRDIIERQLQPRGARALEEALDAGDPVVSEHVRHAAADRLEAANEKLQDPDASLRDTVAAAFESSSTAAFAADQGWIGDEA